MTERTQTLKIEKVPYSLMTDIRVTATRGDENVRKFVLRVLGAAVSPGSERRLVKRRPK